MTTKIASTIGFAAWLATFFMLCMKMFGDTDLGYFIVFLPVIITTALGALLLATAKWLEDLSDD